jgi:hypothetical protein
MKKMLDEMESLKKQTLDMTGMLGGLSKDIKSAGGGSSKQSGPKVSSAIPAGRRNPN